MHVTYSHCCGLDVHKKSVTACVLVTADGPVPQKELRTFSTMPVDLLALGDWLVSHAVSHVAMESTGVFWKPIWNLLEDRFTLLLVNAQHVKAVPGRKTDVKDAEWLAGAPWALLRHGLLRASFVPAPPQRELRDLTRLRTVRVRARAAEINRLLNTLEPTGLKLGAVVSDITGVSARAMLEAILAGVEDETALAELAKGRLRAKRAELERALAARLSPHDRFLVAEHLAMLDALDAVIARLDELIAERLAPSAAEVERLDSIPGVGRRTAETLLAEVGAEVARFPTAKHLASWAGLCPGNDVSAGKQGNGKTRKGNGWLRAALCEAAQAAARTKGTALGARYHRLIAHRGEKKATIAVAHSILLAAYVLLRDGTTYQEPGPDAHDRHDHTATRRRHIRGLERMGYAVSLTPLAAD